MRTRFELLAAALGITLVAATTASGSPSLTRPGTIRITDREVKHLHVDGCAPGKGAGDQDFYRQLLFNKRITPNAIGHSDIVCTNTGTGSTSCTGTYFLPRGKIMVGGVISFGSEPLSKFMLPLTGGTGKYDNARGYVNVRQLYGGRTNLDFHVLP